MIKLVESFTKGEPKCNSKLHFKIGRVIEPSSRRHKSQHKDAQRNKTRHKDIQLKGLIYDSQHARQSP
jgi:hypothetical protein